MLLQDILDVELGRYCCFFVVFLRPHFVFVVFFEMLDEQLHDILGMSSIPVDTLGMGFLGTRFSGFSSH
jgi:hypothetical protein